MGNETTAGTVAGLSPVAVLVEALATYFFPGPLESAPAGTVAAAFLALASYLLPTGAALVAKVLGTSVLAIVLGAGLGSLPGCSALGIGGTGDARQDAINVCTAAGKVYAPVQIGILGAVRAPIVKQADKEALLVIDTAAVGALADCEDAVTDGDAGATDAAIAALSGATARAMKALVGLGVIEGETTGDAGTTEVN